MLSSKAAVVVPTALPQNAGAFPTGGRSRGRNPWRQLRTSSKWAPRAGSGRPVEVSERGARPPYRLDHRREALRRRRFKVEFARKHARACVPPSTDPQWPGIETETRASLFRQMGDDPEGRERGKPLLLRALTARGPAGGRERRGTRTWAVVQTRFSAPQAQPKFLARKQPLLINIGPNTNKDRRKNRRAAGSFP